MTGTQRALKRRSSKGLDRNDLHTLAIPRRDSADESTTADSDKQRVEVRILFFEFHSQRALAQKRFSSFVSMNRKRARLGHPCLASLECISVTVSGDDQLRAVVSNAVLFRNRAYGRDKDRRRPAQLHRSKSDCNTVIATRSSDNTGRWNLAGEQVCKRAPRLERSRVLEEFEFKNDLD